MVQMNQFTGQKLRHGCREQAYGQQRGKVEVGGDGEKKEKRKGRMCLFKMLCVMFLTCQLGQVC